MHFLTSLILRKKYRASAVSFPLNVASVKEILIVLPEKQIDVLYQLQNIIGLITLFKHAGVTLICERETTSLVKMMPGLNVVEYDIEARKTFAKEFTGLAREFRGVVDICFLLEKKPDLGLLYLVGATAAATRVGYLGAGSFPYLNVQVSPSKARKYIPEWNCSMTDLFGGSPEGVCWSVAPKILDEIDHLLKESKIKRKNALIGVDILFIYRKFGQAWAASFLQSLKELNKGEIYLYIEHNPQGNELDWVKAQKFPVLANLSESRTAALISRSDLIISGNTFIFVVSGLLNRPAIGFFHESEIESYCPQSSIHKGISYSGNSEKEKTEMLGKALTLLSGYNFKTTVK